MSRNLAFWVLVIIVPFIVIQLVGSSRKETQELGYTEFLHQLDQGNVLKVTVIDGKQLEGELRAPIGGQDSGREFWTKVPVLAGEDLLTRLENSGVAIEAEDARPNWIGLLAGALPWIFLFGLMLFWLRQMQAGGSRAFSFGKSKAKLLSGDTPKVTFADVAGCDEAKDELQETIDFLKDPSRFTRLGGRLPKGALLVGPPGTGKTLLARAVAGEASRPFFSMSGSDFVEMFVGVGASRVRDLFEQGKAHAPCIIFIDELDAVGRHRGAGLGGGHDEREQTLNQLLVEMDGFESNEGVILIAATNRPDVLDPALLRPGRFDRQIVVDAPDVKGREGILRVHTRKIPLADDVDLGKLAKATPGMSGADLANMVNEAALLAARRDKDRVDMKDLEESKDRVLLGAERRSMVISEEERRLTAYHEAGHAVAANYTEGCDPLHKVTIVPRGRALGLTFSMPEDDRHNYSKQYLRAQLVYAYGGRVAEELIFGPEMITTGAGNDIERATALSRRMISEWGMSEKIGPMHVGDRGEEIFLGRELVERREVSEEMAQLVDSEVRNLLDEAYDMASGVIRENEDKLHRLAQALLERETLDSDEIKLIFEGKELPPLPEELLPEDGKGQSGRRESESGKTAGGVNTKLEPAAASERSQGKATKPETSR
ncbi:MAG: ATP-dependent metallopeptidase FtsH/Yme1/Tma family protein [Gemmatimonadetes bacterium]|uniref:ATP-dependent zinc metalloprotease FtsH n=1 Tax=Candidatus Kutchimonas denitrificans TaxID=3056748 RepID=A0AAE5CAE0_9BACT|nr:ATP-dependent metallopeptidase FtsH/Yme1/Tma family protein [Gemmatimonadota bacterium]NIR74507.1 ATP-dependent metallopeptidase FtsH/Yme1/Tma family protein [Candidatus Kutchimonas denitrificans]NIS02697.1 ATP-dependent metallopeptidase FtsH/Yme1/Tma family protein [Gemmatimonadota bacterium]NIT68858.1 ATP-dependent metallopeptidase FtsH/Yme1/Tma family protein [Gemmatimonadota bacterium]NIU52163.1 ATP-dependent zinc metalloprotease FtsH [Gemmatimonadota bacterium]